MYIHSKYKFTHKNESTQYYKKLLKEISSINMRRSNKFNILRINSYNDIEDTNILDNLLLEANKKSEAAAIAAQKKQETFAQSEKKKADTKLEEQRSRILKGQQGKGGLLFGSELGVTGDTKKQTLGA